MTDNDNGETPRSDSNVDFTALGGILRELPGLGDDADQLEAELDAKIDKMRELMETRPEGFFDEVVRLADEVRHTIGAPVHLMVLAGTIVGMVYSQSDNPTSRNLAVSALTTAFQFAQDLQGQTGRLGVITDAGIELTLALITVAQETTAGRGSYLDKAGATLAKTRRMMDVTPETDAGTAAACMQRYHEAQQALADAWKNAAAKADPPETDPDPEFDGEGA